MKSNPQQRGDIEISSVQVTSRSKRLTALAATASVMIALNLLSAVPASAATNCTVVKMSSTAKTTACVMPSDLTQQNFVSIWNDSVSNMTAQPISATCKATTKGTVSFSYSFSGNGTIKAWVFADVGAKASGGIKATISTGIDVSSTFNIPPHRVTNCDRGIVRQNFTSRLKMTTMEKGRPPKIVYESHSGFGPVRAQWLIKQI